MEAARFAAAVVVNITIKVGCWLLLLEIIRTELAIIDVLSEFILTRILSAIYMLTFQAKMVLSVM